jgi:lipoate-protein ligase A
MIFLDRTLPELAGNLALDEALLVHAESGAGGEVLRTWEWVGPAVVVGIGCRLAEDVDEAACAADGVPILRRSSGGGTVLLGPGCLLFSLVLSYERSAALREIRPSYAWILDHVGSALGPRAAAGRAGISDLVVAGRKCSGNAQQRKSRYLLHHGTLLYDFDAGRVGRYLRQPARQPDYRRGRPHEEFLINLSATAEELKAALRATWSADRVLLDYPQESVNQLTREKYARQEWTRRR